MIIKLNPNFIYRRETPYTDDSELASMIIYGEPLDLVILIDTNYCKLFNDKTKLYEFKVSGLTGGCNEFGKTIIEETHVVDYKVEFHKFSGMTFWVVYIKNGLAKCSAILDDDQEFTYDQAKDYIEMFIKQSLN